MRKTKMEVQLNEEIRAYTEKVGWGLNVRQCVCGGIGLAVGAGIYVLVSVVGGLASVVGAMAGFGVMIVPFLFGFYEWYGQPFEVLVLVWLRMYVMTPRMLFHRPDNPYLELVRTAEAEKDDKGRRKNAGSKKNRN